MPLKKGLRLAAIVAIALLLIPFIRHAGDEIAGLQKWIETLGALAPLAFIAAVLVLTSVFVPSSILSAAGGALFGLGWGTLYMGLGMVAAAALNYFLANKLLGNMVAGPIARQPKLLAIQRAVRHKGLPFQFILRLAPLNAMTVNYVLATAGVRFPPYLIASLGVIPGTFAEVYFGHVASHLSKVAAGSHPHSPTHTILTVGGFLVVIAAMVIIGRIAKKALDEAASAEA